MRWFRSNARGGSRLALFALAVQLAVTFGHVHLQGLALASTKAAPIALADRSAQAVTADPNRKSRGSADYDCPICALIQLASTSAPSAAPVLPAPALIGGFRLETPDELRSDVSAYFSFQARGPPAI
jgi:hypothetical protein